MELALAEAGPGLVSQELALDFLPGLVCAAAYACGPSGAPSPSVQGTDKREKDKSSSSHSSSTKSSSSSSRRSANVKLAPVPSPELLAALADLTAHMNRFHVSQVSHHQRSRTATYYHLDKLTPTNALTYAITLLQPILY